MRGIARRLTFGAQHAVVEVERLRHAIQMRRGRQHHEHVEYLVRTAPDVEGAGGYPFGESSLHHC